MSFCEKTAPKISLLTDGKEAFPEILRCIAAAQRTICVNMFIWRDDEIGNRVAAAILAAAERGVQVELSVDRYGVVLEKAEECKRSFFHKRQSLTEKLKTAVLELLYPMPGTPKCARDEETELYRAIMNHPNIRVEKDKFKADHSKYYIIDDEILFLGGINIEDKENGCDLSGRVYGDYMARLCGKTYVEAFRTKLKTGQNTLSDVLFGVNLKQPVKRFEMEQLYLDLIHGARTQLHITMAYFSPLPAFMDAIIAAHRRGVRVTIVIPEKANFQNDSNRRAMRKLLKATGGGIEVCLSPRMLHTKLVMNEQTISFGSTNITKKAFAQLDELNLFVRRTDSAFTQVLLNSVAADIATARRICSYRDISYRRLFAFLEGFMV